MLDVAAALVEIQEKSPQQIHAATAWTWASRAIAYVMMKDGRNPLFAAIEASCARGEALEHAALAEDGGETLRAIEDATRGIL